MTRTLDEIRDEALGLGVEERGALADSLWESFLTPEEREIQDAWIEEAERRIAAYEAGQTKAIPAEEFFRELRAKSTRARRRTGR